MKRFFLLLFLLFILQNEKVFSQSMSDELTISFNQFDNAVSFSEMMTSSSALELIAITYPEEYISNYYASYSKAMVSYYEKEAKKRDLLIDAAEVYFGNLNQLKPNEQETYILAALIANARLSVDGGSRWKKYGAIFDENLSAAKLINTTNPKINHLKGVAVFNTPKMFGGGKKNALEYLEKAKSQFQTQSTNTILIPYWGSKRNEFFLNQCYEIKK
jgi:hypothetical protein